MRRISKSKCDTGRKCHIQKKNHDGEPGVREVLEGDEVEACAMEICADADVDVTGAMTMAEAAQ